jgi:predicted dehydrogenase
MLKVGLIGTGGIGRLHAQVYRDRPDTSLAAVCDIAPEKALALAEEFDAAAYADVEEMLAAEELDAVSVATAGFENGSHHYQPVMQALRAGVAVLCEKPISNDIEQAREMARTARELGVPLGVNLNHRFTPAAARLKSLLSAGELGEVLFVNMALWFGSTADPSPYHHIRALHPHSIDVMRFFGGDIAAVHCFMTRAPGKLQSYSTLSLNVQFASGAIGCLTGSQDMSWNHPIERCEVGAAQGRAVIDNVFARLQVMPRGSADTLVIENGIFGMSDFNATFPVRIGRFVEQVISGEPLEADGEDGLAAQEVIEAAIASQQSGSVVEVRKTA